MDELSTLALSLLGASLALLFGAALLPRRSRWLRLGLGLAPALGLLPIAALVGVLAIGTQGYRALTREEVAARVELEPQGAQRFRARFAFPGGRQESFELLGDELYVDAHILKWQPVANLLGLHTDYRLDRVAGRYAEVADEARLPRSVFPLDDGGPVDLFRLRRRLPLLAWLVDAEYGSATFVPADHPAHYEVRVSTTGLLVREAPPPTNR